MPHLTFTIYNSNDDQSFTVNDLIDKTKNPIWTGAINHNDSSPSIQCWMGSNDRGQVEIIGTESPVLMAEIRENGDEIRY